LWRGDLSIIKNAVYNHRLAEVKKAESLDFFDDVQARPRSNSGLSKRPYDQGKKSKVGTRNSRKYATANIIQSLVDDNRFNITK
jgi:hypothetical protein